MSHEIGNEKVFKFDTPEVFLIGEYVQRISSMKYEGNHDYVFVDDNKDRYLVFGTAVLNSKMRMAELGKRYKITYLGEVTNEETKLTYRDFRIEELS